MTSPRAIIFDFDGVLLDTESAIFDSWATLYEREGCTLTREEYAPCLGADYSHWNPASHLESLTGKVYDWSAENAMRQTAIEKTLSSMGLMPGAAELLAWSKTHGIRMVVASSSSRRWVAGWLTRLQIDTYFERLFCRTDGYAVKPDPSLFLASLRYLDLPASDCMIIEDSENGVLAARNAHIPCCAVPCSMTSSGDFSSADELYRDLNSLLSSLQSVATSRPN